MSFWDAASLAAAVTVAMIGILAEKIIEVDFSGLLKRNWKSTRCKKMLAQRKGPWQGTNVQGELRRVFDLVLLPLGKADKELLPARMDKNFRRRMVLYALEDFLISRLGSLLKHITLKSRKERKL